MYIWRYHNFKVFVSDNNIYMLFKLMKYLCDIKVFFIRKYNFIVFQKNYYKNILYI